MKQRTDQFCMKSTLKKMKSNDEEDFKTLNVILLISNYYFRISILIVFVSLSVAIRENGFGLPK